MLTLQDKENTYTHTHTHTHTHTRKPEGLGPDQFSQKPNWQMKFEFTESLSHYNQSVGNIQKISASGSVRTHLQGSASTRTSEGTQLCKTMKSPAGGIEHSN